MVIYKSFRTKFSVQTLLNKKFLLVNVENITLVEANIRRVSGETVGGKRPLEVLYIGRALPISPAGGIL